MHGGQVKICDFGLATSDSKNKVGTPNWQAPEVLRGE